MRQRIAWMLAASCWLLAVPASAEVPKLVRYQGHAVDGNKIPLEGPHTLTFRLYDAETVGTKVWEEIHTGASLNGGHFSVLLGSVTPFASAMDWSTPCWLSIQVDADVELAPRQRLTSVPLALRAETAEKLAGGGSASARACNSASISVPHNTEVKLTFNNERWDTNEIHSTASNTGRLTAPTAGKYFVYAHVVFDPHPTGRRLLRLKFNGTGAGIATQDGPGFNADHTFVSVATAYQFAAGEYVEVAVIQSSGTTLSVNPNLNDGLEFGMVKVD